MLESAKAEATVFAEMKHNLEMESNKVIELKAAISDIKVELQSSRESERMLEKKNDKLQLTIDSERTHVTQLKDKEDSLAQQLANVTAELERETCKSLELSANVGQKSTE